jgi:DNA-binding NarL/FixJ family response regulator
MAATATEEAAVEETEEAEVEETEEAIETGQTTRERAEQLFKDGKSRREIANELGVSYNAIQRLLRGENSGVAAVPATKMIADADGKQRPQNDVVREMVGGGKSVSEVAKELNLTYQNVYRIAKQSNMIPPGANTGPRGPQGRIMVELEGETIPRSEAIRRLYRAGVTRGDIARQLGCTYQAVFAVVSKMPTEDQPDSDEVPEENEETTEE